MHPAKKHLNETKGADTLHGDLFYKDESGFMQQWKQPDIAETSRNALLLFDYHPETYTTALLWFEKYQDEYLRTARETRWKIEMDQKKETMFLSSYKSRFALTERDIQWTSCFRFPRPDGFFPKKKGKLSCLKRPSLDAGTWYLIKDYDDNYRIGWLVCSQIGKEHQFFFSIVTATQICHEVNADNIFSFDNKCFRLMKLEDCIPIVGAKRYRDKNLENAIIHVQVCNQKHLEMYDPGLVNDTKKRIAMG